MLCAGPLSIVFSLNTSFLLNGQDQNRPMDAIKSFKNHKIMTEDCQKMKMQQFLFENRHKIDEREGPGSDIRFKNHGSGSGFS